MTNYRSLVPGGTYGNPDTMPGLKPSVRFNNPGAINGASWEKTYPGFVKTIMIAGNNPASVFEAPEYGVAAWLQLLMNYAKAGATTVHDIITKYGGSADYSSYVTAVVKWSGLKATDHIVLTDDALLLKFAKAMFRMEAGAPSPLHDDQILFGFKIARQHALGAVIPVTTNTTPSVSPTVLPSIPTDTLSQWKSWASAVGNMFAHAPSTLTVARILKLHDTGDDVKALQTRLHSIGYSDLIIDGSFGIVTEHDVRSFQLARNLDPDGEVGPLTLVELNKPDAPLVKPPLSPPPVTAGEAPKWYKTAVSLIGFHETGNNQGLNKLIQMAGFGANGWQWCALFVGACLESNQIKSTRAGTARSYEIHPELFTEIKPSLGGIVTMWRKAKVPRGIGHIFFADGIDGAGNIRGIGGNESDMVKRSMHDKSHIVNPNICYWPKGQPIPTTPLPLVNSAGIPLATKVT